VKKLLIIGLLFCLVIGGLKSETQSIDTLSHSVTGLTKQYFKSYWQNTKDFVLSPLKWNKREIIGATAFAGVSALVFINDKRIYNFVQKSKSPLLDNISKYGLEPIGSGLYPFIGFGSLYMYGLLTNDNFSKKFSLLAAKTVLISGLMSQLTKSVFGRHRPYNNDPPDPGRFTPFTFKYSSYVSGHTCLAFSVATIIAMEFNEKPWVPVISYTMATMAGLSRIYDNKHWPMDVLGGAILGYSVGRFLYKKDREIKIIPAFSSAYSGISMQIPIN